MDIILDEKNQKNSNRKNNNYRYKFANWIINNAQTFFRKINNKRQFTSLRDTFGILIPLIIIGGTGTLVSTIIFGGSGAGYVSLMGLLCKIAHPSISWMSNLNSNNISIDGIIKGYDIAINAGFKNWSECSKIFSSIFSVLNTATIGYISIYTSFLIGYFLGKSKGFASKSICGVFSLAAFIVVCMGKIDFYKDSNGLILSILSSICFTELMMWLSSFNRLRIRIYSDVPEILEVSFSLLIPILISFLCILSLDFCFMAPSYFTDYFKVTQNNFSSFQVGDFFGTNGLIDKSVIQKLSEDTDNFFQDENLKKSFQDFLNQFFNGNVGVKDFFSRFEEYVNDLNTSEQSNIAAYLVHTLKNSSLSFNDLDNGNNVINFVSTNGVYLFNINYTSTVIEGLNYGIGSALYQFIILIFLKTASNNQPGLYIALFYVFFVGLLWFFGIHGANVMIGIFQPLFLSILTVNLQLVDSLGYEQAAASGQMGVFTTTFFDSFVWVGGSGASLLLSLCLVSFSRRKELVEISKISTTFSIFQMNEPVIFGVPIILNFRYFIPFIMVPFFNTIIGWIVSPAVLNWVHYSYIQIPWSTPFAIAGAISTLDLRAILVAIFIFIFGFLCYMPFVFIDNHIFLNDLKQQDIEKYESTLKYFKSKRYRFEIKTEHKVNSLYRKSEEIMANAKEKNNYFDIVYKNNTRKLFEYKESNISKAQTQSDELIFKAKVLKANRDQMYLTREPMWNKKEEKRRTKEIARKIKKKNKKNREND